VLNGFQPEVVLVADVKEEELIIHDETNYNITNMLTRLHDPMPLALGVLRRVDEPIYDQQVQKQVDAVKEKKGKGDMQALLLSGETWDVK